MEFWRFDMALEHDLLALTWVGHSLEEGAPWQTVESTKGKLRLRHPHLGEWTISDPNLPACPP